MQKMLKKSSALISGSLLLSMVYFNKVQARFGPFQDDFGKVLKTLFTFVFGAAGVVFVILFLVGGIQYLTSAGNEEASTKAKKLLIDAVIGLVIVVISYAAATWIIRGIGGEIDPVIQ